MIHRKRLLAATISMLIRSAAVIGPAEELGPAPLPSGPVWRAASRAFLSRESRSSKEGGWSSPATANPRNEKRQSLEFTWSTAENRVHPNFWV